MFDKQYYECPKCNFKNVYTDKEINKANEYNYCTCKNCGIEFTENGLLDLESD